MEKISTGVEGLDRILGGYPYGKVVLITGNAGSGKTIMALHLIKAQCSQGKRCAYVAIEETRDDLLLQASQFGWDFKDYEERDLLRIIPVLEERMVEAKYQFTMYGPETGFGVLLDLIGREVEVVVIDNIGVMALDMNPPQFRQQLDFLVYTLSKMRCTTLLISDESIMKDKKEVALYSVHGAIKLMKRDNPYTDTRERVLEIVKMRSMPAPIEYVMFEINKEGIYVFS